MGLNFDWTQIAGPLLKIGVTTAGTVLGGPAGAMIGNTVGPILAEALGVPATPEAVGAAIEADPERGRQAANSGEFQVALANAVTAQMQIVNDTYRLELQSDHWFVRSWRPAMGWTMVLVVGVHGLAIGLALFRRDFELIRTIPDLTVFYAGPLAVVGVAAWGRTKEKIAGVAGVSEGIGGLIGQAINSARR